MPRRQHFFEPAELDGPPRRVGHPARRPAVVRRPDERLRLDLRALHLRPRGAVLRVQVRHRRRRVGGRGLESPPQDVDVGTSRRRQCLLVVAGRLLPDRCGLRRDGDAVVWREGGRRRRGVPRRARRRRRASARGTAQQPLLCGGRGRRRGRRRRRAAAAGVRARQ